MAKPKIAVVDDHPDHDSHRGMRYGVLDLIRCTEQTAVLMASAEGRGIKREAIARCATLSMAGFVSQAMYRPRISILDEIYERYGSKGDPVSDPAKIWAAVAAAGQSAKKGDEDLALDFSFAPVDGKHALAEGQTGGTVSSLCFAPYKEGASAVFAAPRDRSEESKGPGAPKDADRSPPWLILAGSKEFVDRFDGRDILYEFVKKTARNCIGKPVEALIFELFENGPDVTPSSTAKVPIRINQALAVLNEPRYMAGWNRQAVPLGRKRLFVGSSIALALASMFRRKGFDCSLAISRHAHAIQASVAARVLDGVVIAVPLRAEKLGAVEALRPIDVSKKKDANKNQTTLVVESDDVWTQNRFVTSNNAAMIVSGISEHVILEPVRFRENKAKVNTLCLSARTKSVRVLDHWITLDGPSATRFVSLGQSALKHLDEHGALPEPEWHLAGVWKSRFEEMFEMEEA